MNFKFPVCVVVATFAALSVAVPASAEIVLLSSRRTLSVKSHRVEGDSIILTLRGGGEVTCDKSLIERIDPDEVPYIEPVVASAEQDPSPASVQPERPLLDGTPYAEIIASLAQAHGVDPMLVSALIGRERMQAAYARAIAGGYRFYSYGDASLLLP